MKKVLKTLCLLLALAMVLSACGGDAGSSSTPSSSTPGSSAPESSTPESSVPESSAGGEEAPTGGYAFEEHKNEPVTISIYVEDPGTMWEKWGEDPVSKKITEETGISFECVAPVTDDDTKLSLLIASDDLPDVVTSWYGRANWATMVQQGQLADLEAVASEYAPKYFSELIDPELANFNRQDDGTVRYLVSCWNTSETLKWLEDHNWLVTTNQPVILMRQDYLQEIGSPEITTPQKFLEACKEIKAKHPDTIPFYTGGNTQNGPSYLRWLFGPCSYYVAEDGTVSGSYRDPRYLDMYLWVNEMVREGLMTEDSFVDGDTEKDAKSLAGEVASYLWTVGETGKVPADNPDTTYYPMQPWDTYEAVRSNAGYIRFGISEKSEHKDAAMRWLEYGSSEIGARTMYWGVEGNQADGWSGDVVNGPHCFSEEDGEWGQKITYFEGFQDARNADWSGTEKKSGLGFYGAFVNGNTILGSTAECMPTDLMKQMNQWYAPKVRYDDALVFSLPAGSDESVTYQSITSLVSEYNIKWAFAASAEEVKSLYNEFIGRVENECNEAGLNQWYTEQYKHQQK